MVRRRRGYSVGKPTGEDTATNALRGLSLNVSPPVWMASMRPLAGNDERTQEFPLSNENHKRPSFDPRNQAAADLANAVISVIWIPRVWAARRWGSGRSEEPTAELQ